ncbi:periplasmic heavy metal sensor [Arenibacterium sp. CAU 1754]
MSMEPDTKPRRRLWMRLLFGGSLALNLLFVGLFVGAAMRFGGPDRKPPQPSVGAALFREMPREDRRALFSSMRSHREINGGRRASEAQAVIQALRAQPFDPDALSRVVGQQLNRRSTWLAATQDDWLARVADMSAQDRNAYADRIEQAMSGQSRQKRRWWRN